MTFIVDNVIYLLTYFLHLGKPIEPKKPEKPTPVTVLIPVRGERREVVEESLRHLQCGHVVERWVLCSRREDYEEMKPLSVAGVNVILVNDRSKADALNKALPRIPTEYALIVDAGDIVENVEELLKYVNGYSIVFTYEKGYANGGLKWWQRLASVEMTYWTSRTLRIVKRRMGATPVPGTGLIVRRNVRFPETLAEDATLGMTNRSIGYAPVPVFYRLPGRLTHHLKQRARWYAGYLQSLKYAKGGMKLICLLPVVCGMVPVSLLLMPFVMFLFNLYALPWLIVDWVAFIAILTHISMLVKFNGKTLVLAPLWWLITGLSFYISVYYLATRKWYYTPK